MGTACHGGAKSAPAATRRRVTMTLLIGTSNGVFTANASGATEEVKGLAGHEVRALRAVNGSLFAGAENGVYVSKNGGQTWKLSGVEGQIVWDIAPAPGDEKTVYVGTQPAALFRTRDGGETWAELDSMKKIPGSEKWCVPNSPAGARARTLVLDASNPGRYWVGLEIGGVLSTPDDGATWTSVMTGGDIHVMTADPARAGVLYMTTGFGRYADDPQPREERIAGAFRSKDGGQNWEYLWKD